MSQDLINSIWNFLPEIALILTLLLISFNKSVFTDSKIKAKQIAVAGILISMILSLFQLYSEPAQFFSSMLAVDPFAVFGKISAAVFITIMILFKRNENDIRKTDTSEYLIFICALALGCFVSVSSANLLMLFISFALCDLCIFFLISFVGANRETSGNHLKYIYFLLFSGIIMLTGIMIIFGLTGKLDYIGISSYLSLNPFNHTSLLLAALLVLMGFASKMLLVPFQFAAYRLIDSLSTKMLSLLSGLIPVIGFLCLSRFFLTVFRNSIANEFDLERFIQLPGFYWNGIIIIISAVTIIFTSLMMLRGKSLKKIFFHLNTLQSAILLIGLLSLTETGLRSSIGFAISFLTLSIGMAFVINETEINFRTESLSELTGAGGSNRFLFAPLFILMISCAGIPPSFGFISRIAIYNTAISSAENWILIVQILSSITIAYTTFRIYRNLFLLQKIKILEQFDPSFGTKIILLIITLPAIFAGLYYAPIAKLADLFGQMYGVH